MSDDDFRKRCRLSLCMIVRDGAETLARCLESVRGLADEIIVVDTGSSDATPEIARAHGAEIVTFPWRDDFSAARNASLARAGGAWILVLDADEWLPPASVPALRALVTRPPDSAYHLIQHSVDPRGAGVRAPAVRLFPNRPDVRYRFPLHEEVNASLRAAGVPLRAAAVEFLHSGYADEATVARKLERNRRIVAAALARGPAPDEELQLRFYRASLDFDVQAWARAADDFSWCVERARAIRPAMLPVARLRAAECWFELGDAVRAQQELPAQPTRSDHPLVLALAARLAARRGDAAEARRVYRLLGDVRAGPFTPPVAIAPLQREAAEWLQRGE